MPRYYSKKIKDQLHFVVPTKDAYKSKDVVGLTVSQSVYDLPGVRNDQISYDYIRNENKDGKNFDKRNHITEEEYVNLNDENKISFNILTSIFDSTRKHAGIHKMRLMGAGYYDDDDDDENEFKYLTDFNNRSPYDKNYHLARIINHYDEHFSNDYGPISEEVFYMFKKQFQINSDTTYEGLKVYRNEVSLIDDLLITNMSEYLDDKNISEVLDDQNFCTYLHSQANIIREYNDKEDLIPTNDGGLNIDGNKEVTDCEEMLIDKVRSNLRSHIENTPPEDNKSFFRLAAIPNISNELSKSDIDKIVGNPNNEQLLSQLEALSYKVDGLDEEIHNIDGSKEGYEKLKEKLLSFRKDMINDASKELISNHENNREVDCRNIHSAEVIDSLADTLKCTNSNDNHQNKKQKTKDFLNVCKSNLSWFSKFKKRVIIVTSALLGFVAGAALGFFAGGIPAVPLGVAGAIAGYSFGVGTLATGGAYAVTSIMKEKDFAKEENLENEMNTFIKNDYDVA